MSLSYFPVLKKILWGVIIITGFGLPIADGSNNLFHLREGTLEGAKRSIAIMEREIPRLEEEERDQSLKKIQIIKRLFMAEGSYQKALKGIDRAKDKASEHKERARHYMVPSKTSGRVAKIAADQSLKKAKEILEDALSEREKTKEKLSQLLVECDLYACDLYGIKDKKDAQSLSDVVELMKQRNELMIRTDFRLSKVKADRYEAQLLKEQNKINSIREKEELMTANDLLCKALQENDSLKVKRALDRGASPNLYKGAVLREAIENDSLEIVRLLIAAGGKLDIRGDDGMLLYFCAKTDRMRDLLRTVGKAPDSKELELVSKGWYVVGSVTRIMEDGFFMKKMEKINTPIGVQNVPGKGTLRLTNQQIFVEFGDGGKNETMTRLAEGDVCFFCYTKKGNYKKEIAPDRVQTLQKLTSLNSSFFIKDYEDFIYKGKITQVLDNGVLALVNPYDPDKKLPSRQGLGRLTYIYNHPRHSELYDGAPIYIQGDRVESYVHQKNQKETTVIPKVECVEVMEEEG